MGAGTLMEICGYLVLTGRVLSGRMDLAEYVPALKVIRWGFPLGWLG